jgi:TDG/mug DNA glycosylase family protein
MLPDRIRPGLRLLFVGINPSLRSAELGHHYAGRGNRFWRLVFDAGLVPEPLTYADDVRLPEWGYGLTNLVRRPTRSAAELTPEDYATGKRRLARLLRRHTPAAAALVGITLYRALDRRHAGSVLLGQWSGTFAGTPLIVLPNPSGRNAAYTYRDMCEAFARVPRLLRRLQSTNVQCL